PRKEWLKQEMAVMKALPARHWSAPTTRDARVTKYGIISVDRAAYSVPSRLIGSKLKVLVYSDTIRAFFRTKLAVELPRQEPCGKLINWRDVAAPLLKKPGAFATFMYHDDCFPSPVFRQAYEALQKWNAKQAAKEYLSVLVYAADTDAQEVGMALELLLEAGQVPLLSAVRELAQPLPNNGARTDTAIERIFLIYAIHNACCMHNKDSAGRLAAASDKIPSDSVVAASDKIPSDSVVAASDTIPSDSVVAASDTIPSDSVVAASDKIPSDSV